MRYITADRLTEGMVVGKPFFSYLGSVMLQKGYTLTESSIRRIRELQYSGLYIDDKISEGIEITDTISDELRSNVTNATRRLFTNIELNGDAHFDDDMHRLSSFLDSVLDEILSSSSRSAISVIDIKEFDLYTYQHSVNVCVLSCIIGMAQNMARSQLRNLGLAALLHDIGKLFIDKRILNKPGKLTPEEFDEIKAHPMLGYDCLRKKQSFPSSVTMGILHHHERCSGGGYPLGIAGEEIVSFARIISVADVYDAITSVRPYHDAILPSEAYEYIMGNGGQLFSWEVVNTFTRKIAPFPLGMQVLLSDGRMGVVYKNRDETLTRPIVRLLPTPEEPGVRFCDLHADPGARSVTIQKVFM